MENSKQILGIFILIIVLSCACNGVEYYVSPIPLPNTDCPQSSVCLLLNDFAKHIDKFFSGHRNISLFFLNGTHDLDFSFYVKATTNNSLLSVHMVSADDRYMPEIVVPHKIELFFAGLQYLCFKNIGISGNDLPPLYFTLVFVGNSKVDFGKSIFRGSSMNITYPANQNKNSVSNIESMTSFTHCKLLRSSILLHYNFESPYGNVMHYNTSKGLQRHEPSSTDMHRYKMIITRSIIDTGSLNVRVNSVKLEMIVCDCYLTGANDFESFGMSNSLIGHHEDDRSQIQLQFINTTIANSTTIGIAITEIYNISLSITQSLITDISYRGMIVSRIYNFIEIEINETTFTKCHQGAVLIDSNAHLIVKNSIFVENSNWSPENGVGVTVSCLGSKVAGVQMSNVVFTLNHGHADYGRVVDISLCNSVDFSNVLFKQNTGTCVKLSSNDFHVTGALQFINNTAYRGSGLSLLYSRMYLYNDTSIMLYCNTVSDVGGGIYVEQSNPFIPTTSTHCFYVLPEVTSFVDIDYLNISVLFVNNTATNGGLAIYGASVADYCLAALNAPIYSGSIYQKIFGFGNSSLTNPLKSTVTSDPSRVCLCDEMYSPQCISLSHIFARGGSAFPGESVYIPAVTVGKDFGAVTGAVFANPLGDALIDSGQYTQMVLYSQCNILTYTVFSKPFSNFSLVLTATSATTNTYGDKYYVESIIYMFPYEGAEDKIVMSLPVYINYTVEDCPIGFVLTNAPPFRCECNTRLLEEGVKKCVICNHTGLIYRIGSTWLGAINDEGKGNYQLVSNWYCPTGYCKDDNISIDLIFPDEQCAGNRSGLLCGKCQENLSLSLGTSFCIQCNDNRYLTLILPFVFGIIILVVLIRVLDLTVRHGTLNGIIFYANIVWAHRSIFFDNYEIAETFIGWLNLELGIDTCFIKGLDAFGKTLLFFAQDFVNIIGVTGLIVLSTRYSRLAIKVLGKNVVHILATLFFLSYTKLLQTIISSLSFHILQYPEEVKIVWSLDGNLPYFGPKHLSLFLLAMGALTVLWVPYSVVLLFFQCLHKKSYLKPLRWLDSLRLKPYTDAYFGPLKVSYQYWFGLLLLARVILVLTNAFSLLYNPYINLLAIVTVTTLLLCHPLPYESWKLSIFENVVLLNLIFLSSSVLLVQVVTMDKAYFVYISTTILFVQLSGVLVYHSYMAVNVNCFKKAGQPCINGQHRPIEDEESSCNDEREPLLNILNDQ